MSDRLTLPTRYRREVERILEMVVPDVKVWAYGSRVTGTAYEQATSTWPFGHPDWSRSGQCNWERS